MKSVLKNLSYLPFLMLSLAGMQSPKAAIFTDFTTPSFRGEIGSESAQWDVFTTAVGAPGNAANSVASGGVSLSGAIITQTTPGAFLTGGGNIYSFATASTFVLTDTVDYPTGLGLVVFQANSLGTPLDYSSVTLTYEVGGVPTSLTTPRVEVYRASLGGFGGDDIVSSWEWDLSGLAIKNYSIHFNASGSSLSFDKATLDTQAYLAQPSVPEPEQYGAIAGTGVIAFSVWRRYRRTHS